VKKVGATENLHTADWHRQPLGVACGMCSHRGLVPLERIGAHSGDMKPIRDLPLKCSKCGSKWVSAYLFVKREEAEAFMQEGPKEANYVR
jgi:hypothetical protein